MRRILVVDNDRDVLVSITNVLRAEFPELDVRVAADPQSARTLASDEPFDLVLADAAFQDGLDGRVVPLRKPIDPEALLDLVRGPPE